MRYDPFASYYNIYKRHASIYYAFGHSDTNFANHLCRSVGKYYNNAMFSCEHIRKYSSSGLVRYLEPSCSTIQPDLMPKINNYSLPMIY